jgi:polysaccharide export outer membrane protein
MLDSSNSPTVTTGLMAEQDVFRHHSLLLLALAIAAFALLGGCTGTRGGPVPYNVTNFGEPDSPVVATVDADYRLAPADTVQVSVFQVQDLSGQFEVDLLGNISMPLIGTLKAADLTTRELDAEITKALGQKYLQNPDVSVALKSSARRNVTVDGSVATPGMYPINGPTTLVQAIALAHGVSPDSNPHRVAIFRTIDGKRMGAAFDLYSIRKGQMEDPEVFSGDIIVVDGSKVRQIQNQVLMSLPIIGMFNPIIY